MIHDRNLVERLSGYPEISYEGEVFRATRMGLDPLAFSTLGGRWSLSGGVSVLYASLAREGALAELAFHWNLLNPRPTKPAVLHRIGLTTRKTLRLIETDMGSLGVVLDGYRSINYKRTQEIGAAAAFLGFDGLIAPSARWACENMVLFMENQRMDDRLEVIEQEEIDWRSWAANHGMVGGGADKEAD